MHIYVYIKKCRNCFWEKQQPSKNNGNESIYKQNPKPFKGI